MYIIYWFIFEISINVKTNSKIDFSFHLLFFFFFFPFTNNLKQSRGRLAVRSGILSFIPMSNAMLDIINISVAPNLYRILNRYRFVDRTYTARKKIILLSACKDKYGIHLRSKRFVHKVYGHHTFVTTRYKCMQL